MTAPNSPDGVQRARRRHASGRRHTAATPRRRHPVVTGLAFTAYGVVAAIVVICAGAGISGHAALAEPVHWGTYRQTDLECHAERHGTSCWSTGTWVADDESLVLHDVGLDASTVDPEDAPRGPVRAGFRDWDADEDGVPDDVYDASLVDTTWVTPLVFAGVAAAAGVFMAARWGDLERLWWWHARRRASR